ncbi:SemiSWEET family sugar transporter [Lewinella sp. IMCC34183]|uniref:SemiSWEET family sugar transporter n=1 Tax=Lewinella sp. IMCC34183 TaxID=2248762 RepID=UPI000E287CC9|nr:SemiSWEET transporter [Lewinella sp. IMCC34183]
MTLISLTGALAAFLTTAAFVPQAYKTIRYRATDDLSLATFSMLLIGTILWLVYGYYIGDLPLMVANGITASLAGLIFLLKVRSMRTARLRR